MQILCFLINFMFSFSTFWRILKWNKISFLFIADPDAATVCFFSFTSLHAINQGCFNRSLCSWKFMGKSSILLISFCGFVYLTSSHTRAPTSRCLTAMNGKQKAAESLWFMIWIFHESKPLKSFLMEKSK